MRHLRHLRTRNRPEHGPGAVGAWRVYAVAALVAILVGCMDRTTYPFPGDDTGTTGDEPTGTDDGTTGDPADATDGASDGESGTASDTEGSTSS
jgi:hypothetical protein